MSNEARSIENNELVYHLKANQQKVLKLSGLEPSTFIIRPNYKNLKKPLMLSRLNNYYKHLKQLM